MFLKPVDVAGYSAARLVAAQFVRKIDLDGL
jgi:hypothetical protein